jgi:hypothetical protein
MITANDLAANALERFDDGVDNDNGVNVTFNDSVDAQAYDAASGVQLVAPPSILPTLLYAPSKHYETPLHPLTYQLLFYVLPEYWA